MSSARREILNNSACIIKRLLQWEAVVKISEGQRGAAGKKWEINKQLFMYTQRTQNRRRCVTMKKISSSLTVVYNRRQRYALLSCSVKYDKWCAMKDP